MAGWRRGPRVARNREANRNNTGIHRNRGRNKSVSHGSRRFSSHTKCGGEVRLCAMVAALLLPLRREGTAALTATISPPRVCVRPSVGQPSVNSWGLLDLIESVRGVGARVAFARRGALYGTRMLPFRPSRAATVHASSRWNTVAFSLFLVPPLVSVGSFSRRPSVK